MNRKQLLEVLELVKPALADINVVPIYQNFCFDNGKVYAHNDRLSIIAPAPGIDGVFSVNGKTFSDLLRASSAAEVDLIVESENIILKSGRSRMKLPYMGEEEFLFEEPEEENWSIIIDLDVELVEALKLCLLTSSTDSTMPVFMGVTVKGGDKPALFSCDGDALSRFTLRLPNRVADEQFTMSNDFVESIIRIAGKTECYEGTLYVNEGWAYAELGNDYKVYGRNVGIDEVFDYESQIRKAFKEEPVYIGVPKGFDEALNRARVIGDPDNKSTTITIAGDKMELKTETHSGVVKDTLKIGKGHPDIEVGVAATESCTVYKADDDFLLIVANYSN